jgi:hypothetical protein
LLALIVGEVDEYILLGFKVQSAELVGSQGHIGGSKQLLNVNPLQLSLIGPHPSRLHRVFLLHPVLGVYLQVRVWVIIGRVHLLIDRQAFTVLGGLFVDYFGNVPARHYLYQIITGDETVSPACDVPSHYFDVIGELPLYLFR